MTTARPRMALIGDSLVGGLAPPLKKLVEAGWDFTSLSNIGKSTGWYARQTLISDLVKQFDPYLVIIVLGTNDEGAEDAPANYIRSIEKVLQQAGRAKVVWIGPPTIPRSAEEDAGSAARNKILAQRLGSAAVDGRSMTADLDDKRTPDKVHFTAAGSKVWAERIFAFLQTKLHDATPSSSSFSWKKVVALASIASMVLLGVVYWRK